MAFLLHCLFWTQASSVLWGTLRRNFPTQRVLVVKLDLLPVMKKERGLRRYFPLCFSLSQGVHLSHCFFLPDPSEWFNRFSGWITMDRMSNNSYYWELSRNEQERVVYLICVHFLHSSPFDPRKRLLLSWKRKGQYSGFPQCWLNPSLELDCFWKDPGSLGKVKRDFKRGAT